MLMRTILCFTLLVVLLFPACKNQQLMEKEYIKRIESQIESIHTFTTDVVGLKKGDTIERVFEIYGEPVRHTVHDETYTFNTVYYEVDDVAALTVSYFKATNKIYTVGIGRSAPIFMKNRNLEHKLYIGMHADELRKIFGYREFGIGNSLRYENRELILEFTCSAYNEYKCSEYLVYWRD